MFNTYYTTAVKVSDDPKSFVISIWNKLEGGELLLSIPCRSYGTNKKVLDWSRVLQFFRVFLIQHPEEMDSPPTSKRPSRTNSATVIPRTTSPLSSRHSIFMPNSTLSTQPFVNQESQDI